MSVGQGLETALSAVAAEETGLPFERIAFVQGDTDLVVDGKGNGGSAALTLGGSAIRLGAADLVLRAREMAARLLGVEVAQVGYDAGLLRAAGTNQVIDLGDLAERARADGGAIEGTASFSMAQATFPNGCHVCEVEVDPETGAVEVLRYVSVEDVGRVLNDWLVEGQIHGGVAQGIGQALWEEMVHDSSGQLLAGSFMDYAMPRARDLPMIVSENIEVPTALNPLGVKGVGEAGTVGALAAAANAVCNALQQRGVRHLDMPATPHRVWAALNR
jgi:carbon-monoxide dehydrogenase large subunit